MTGAKGQPELWIGAVELRPLKPKEFGAAGAFTNIVTWACDSDEFRVKAERLAAHLEMFLMRVKTADPLVEGLKKRKPLEEIDEMVRQAEADPKVIVCGKLLTYSHDQA